MTMLSSLRGLTVSGPFLCSSRGRLAQPAAAGALARPPQARGASGWRRRLELSILVGWITIRLSRVQATTDGKIALDGGLRRRLIRLARTWYYQEIAIAMVAIIAEMIAHTFASKAIWLLALTSLKATADSKESALSMRSRQ